MKMEECVCVCVCVCVRGDWVVNWIVKLAPWTRVLNLQWRSSVAWDSKRGNKSLEVKNNSNEIILRGFFF